MSDFESGLRKAIKEVYPQTVINGCWFHYRKCIRKKIKRLGISKLWTKKSEENNPEIALHAKKIYRMFCMLPLLPEQQFSDGHRYVRSIVRKNKLMNEFETFFNYYDRTWVTEVCLKHLKNVCFPKNQSKIYFCFLF